MISIKKSLLDTNREHFNELAELSLKMNENREITKIPFTQDLALKIDLIGREVGGLCIRHAYTTLHSIFIIIFEIFTQNRLIAMNWPHILAFRGKKLPLLRKLAQNPNLEGRKLFEFSRSRVGKRVFLCLLVNFWKIESWLRPSLRFGYIAENSIVQYIIVTKGFKRIFINVSLHCR